MEDKACYFCKTEPLCRIISGIEIAINCSICGQYQITQKAAEHISFLLQISPESDKKQQQIANIIGWLSAKPFQEVDVEDINYLLTMDTPTIAQRADKILKWFGKIIKNMGDSINLKPQISYLNAISYSYNSKI